MTVRARTHVARLVKAGILISLAVSSSPADATGLERLLMPGRVIEGHAEVESDCGA